MSSAPAPIGESASILHETRSEEDFNEGVCSSKHFTTDTAARASDGSLKRGSSAGEDHVGTSAVRLSRPVSEGSTRSVKVAFEEQERTRTEYLQAQGFASVDDRSSIVSVASSGKSGVEEKVKQIEERLRGGARLAGSEAGSVTSAIASRRADGLSRFKVRFSRSSSVDTTAGAASLAAEEEVTADRSGGRGKFKVRTSFENSRTAEAGNWFTARESETVSPRFKPPEGFQDSPSSLETTKAVSVERPSRSASLRIRNNRLPPGYNMPNASLIAGFASTSGVADGAKSEGCLGSASSLGRPNSLQLGSGDSSSNRLDPLVWSTVPRTRSTWSPSGDLSSAFRSGVVSQLTLQGSSQGGSKVTEISKEDEMDTRPQVPPKSPDRLSGRNSALLSNLGSEMLPYPESVVARSTAITPTVETNEERHPWMLKLVFVLLATGLTILGMVKTSPLHHCSLDPSPEEKTCTPPTFSFTHNWRMETTLPTTFHPFLPSLQIGALEDVKIEDHGLNIDLHGSSSAQRMHMHDRLLVGTLFGDAGQMVSNITYVGVVNGGKDVSEAQKMVEQRVREVKTGHSAQAAVSAQSRRSSMGSSKGSMFLAFWLAGMLAVECALLAFWVVLPILCRAAKWVHRQWGPRQREKSVGKTWQREVLSTAKLALRWGMAGALGAAVAGGILTALWN